MPQTYMWGRVSSMIFGEIFLSPLRPFATPPSSPVFPGSYLLPWTGRNDAVFLVGVIQERSSEVGGGDWGFFRAFCLVAPRSPAELGPRTPASGLSMPALSPAGCFHVSF